MVHTTSHARLWISATALIVMAVATTRSAAAESHRLGFGGDGPAMNRCATIHATNPDALPGSEDPAALMSTLRRRGLADADPLPSGRGMTGSSRAQGTSQGSLRCDTLGPGVVFRGGPFNRISTRN